MKTLKLFLGKKEYAVILVAIVVLIAGWIAGAFWEIPVIPPTKFAKVAFAVIAISIGVACVWVWLTVMPDVKKVIDPDNTEEQLINQKELTRWEQNKKSMFFFALLLGCFVLLVIF